MYLRIINIELDSQKVLCRMDWKHSTPPSMGEYIDIDIKNGQNSNHYLIVGLVHLTGEDSYEVYVQLIGNHKDLYSDLRNRISTRSNKLYK